MTMKIDWKKPVEIVTTSGTIHPASVVGKSLVEEKYPILLEVATSTIYRGNDEGKVRNYSTWVVRNVNPKPVAKNYWAVTYLNPHKTLVTAHLMDEAGSVYKIGHDYKGLGTVVHVSEFSLAM